MRRRTLLGLLLAAPLAAHAQVPAAPPPPTLPPAASPIAALNAGLLSIMHAGASTPFATRMKTLQPVVEQTFDLRLILRNSVGPRWTAFDAAQQTALLAAFTDFTVASWVANFDSFDGERFEILPDVRKIGSDQVVRTRIVPGSGSPTRLDYVMRDIDNGWKAVDILLNGSISRVAVQRSDFRAQLASGDPGPLIAMLRDKVTALAAGAKS
jgi:phospholipid transport system substrate-binding protein